MELSKVKGVVWEELDGEAVVVSPSLNRTWRLNLSATYIWKCLDGKTSIEDIARRLAAAGGRELERICQDVRNLCTEMECQGLVRAAGRNGGTVPVSMSFRGLYMPPILTMEHGPAHHGRVRPRGISF